MTAGFRTSGGEAGIRTLGTGVSPYNGLANRRIRPLCHLSGPGNVVQIVDGKARRCNVRGMAVVASIRGGDREAFAKDVVSVLRGLGVGLRLKFLDGLR